MKKRVQKRKWNHKSLFYYISPFNLTNVWQSSDYGCQQPCIYLSNTTHIMAVEASLTHHPLVVVSNLSRAVALDVHVNHGMIFWSDVRDKSIKRASVNGGNIKVIVKDNVGVVDGLAVQWRNDLLYWTDTTNNKIEVSRLDGSRRKVLFSEHLDEPRGIAVDPESGWAYHFSGFIPNVIYISVVTDTVNPVSNVIFSWRSIYFFVKNTNKINQSQSQPQKNTNYCTILHSKTLNKRERERGRQKHSAYIQVGHSALSKTPLSIFFFLELNTLYGVWWFTLLTFLYL